MKSDFLRTAGEFVQRVLKTRTGKVISLVLLSMLAVFVLFDFIVMPVYTRQGADRPVPNLTMVPVQAALEVADSAGFELLISGGKVSTRVPEGWIIEQHPGAGTRAKPGRKIQVIPAVGASPDVVPDLVGLDARDAQLRCKNTGLVCGPTDIHYRFSGRVAKGNVIEQDPRSGSRVTQGSVMKLVVSMGPEPAHFYVPAVVDQPLHDARARLREAGLKLGVIERRETNEFPAGTVVEQSLTPGLEVDAGTEVHVTVAVHERPDTAPTTDDDHSPSPQLDDETVRDSQTIQDSIRAEKARRDSIRKARRRY